VHPHPGLTFAIRRSESPVFFTVKDALTFGVPSGTGSHLNVVGVTSIKGAAESKEKAESETMAANANL
jgi:hypothetical protein